MVLFASYPQKRTTVFALYESYRRVCEACGIPVYPLRLLSAELREILLQQDGGAHLPDVDDDKDQESKLEVEKEQGQSSSDDSEHIVENDENGKHNNNEEKIAEHTKLQGMSAHGLCYIIWTMVVRVMDAYWKLEIYSAYPSQLYPSHYLFSVFDSTVSWTVCSIKTACTFIGISIPEELREPGIISIVRELYKTLDSPQLPQDQATYESQQKSQRRGSPTISHFKDLTADCSNISSHAFSNDIFAGLKMTYQRVAYRDVLNSRGCGCFWAPCVYLDEVKRPTIQNNSNNNSNNNNSFIFSTPSTLSQVESTNLVQERKKSPRLVARLINKLKIKRRRGIDANNKSKFRLMLTPRLKKDTKTLYMEELNNLSKQEEKKGASNVKKQIQSPLIPLRQYNKNSGDYDLKISEELINVCKKFSNLYRYVLLSTIATHKMCIDGLSGEDVDVYNNFLESIGHSATADKIQSRNIFVRGLAATPLEYTLMSIHSCLVDDGIVEEYRRLEHDTTSTDVLAFMPFTGAMLCNDDIEGKGDNIYYSCEDYACGETDDTTNTTCVGISIESSFSLLAKLHPSKYFSHIIKGGIMVSTIPIKYCNCDHNSEDVIERVKEPLSTSFMIDDIKIKMKIPVMKYIRFFNPEKIENMGISPSPTPYIRLNGVQIAVDYPDIVLPLNKASEILKLKKVTPISVVIDTLMKQTQNNEHIQRMWVVKESDVINSSVLCNNKNKKDGLNNNEKNYEEKENGEEEEEEEQQQQQQQQEEEEEEIVEKDDIDIYVENKTGTGKQGKRRAYVGVIAYPYATFRDNVNGLGLSLGILSRVLMMSQWVNRVPPDSLSTLIVQPDGTGVEQVPSKIFLEKNIIVGDLNKCIKGFNDALDDIKGISQPRYANITPSLEQMTYMTPISFLIDLSELFALGKVDSEHGTIVIPYSSYSHLIPNMGFAYSGSLLPFEIQAKKRF